VTWQPLPRAVDLAELVLRLASARTPTLGRGRLVCLDGPTGAGKTVLADAVTGAAAGLGSVRCVHLDDLLDGWDGLPEVAETARRALLEPLSHGRPGRYRRYDWHAEAFAEEHVVEPVDVLVLEGVGSGDPALTPWVTTLVWLDAPDQLRLGRSLERDGEQIRPHLLRWSAQEQALFTRQRTRGRADLVVEEAGTPRQRVRVTDREAGSWPRSRPNGSAS
jgi:hypothetical protein